MSVVIDHDNRRILFSQWGNLDRENIIQSYYVLNGTEGFDPTYDTLVDFQNVEEIEIGFDDIKTVLVETLKVDKRTGRAAIIVGPDTGRYILAKLGCELSVLISDIKVRYKAFQTFDEAEKWLRSKP